MGACDDDDWDPEAAVELPLSDELDLHAFSQRETADVLRAWLDECAAAGFPRVRVVHGKGVGTQREIVREVLDAHPAVASHSQDGGNWGATVAVLRGR